MKNLVKISREELKTLKGNGAPMCPDDPQFRICYPTGFPNGICMTYYQCCIRIGFSEEVCKKRFES